MFRWSGNERMRALVPGKPRAYWVSGGLHLDTSVCFRLFLFIETRATLNPCNTSPGD
jgi:hypothetical protein